MGWIKSIFDTKEASPNPVSFFKQLFKTAIDNKHEVHFDYQGRQGGPKPRRVIPGSIGKNNTFRGYCLDSNMWKNWRFEGIGGLNLMQPRTVEPPEDLGDEGEYGQGTMGPPREEPETLTPKKIKILPPAEAPAKKPAEQQDQSDDKPSDWEHPNVKSFRDAKDSGSQVTFTHSGEQHTVIPRSIGWTGGPEQGTTAVQGYCVQHGTEERLTPTQVSSIDKVEPKSRELPLQEWEARRQKENEEREQNKNVLIEQFAQNAKPKPSVVEPTQEEYDEARSLDIDPDTHDKATYKRIRNLGATHAHCVEASSMGIPYEDYENALGSAIDRDKLDKTGSSIHELHTKALDEASSYQDSYTSTVNKNRALRVNGTGTGKSKEGWPNDTGSGESIVSSFKPLDDETHDDAVENLFMHHLTLRNEPAHTGNYLEVPGGRRANEWIMSECAKLTPEARMGIKNTTFHDKGTLLPTENENGVSGQPANPNAKSYSDSVRTLLNHYTAQGLRVNTNKDFIVNRRKKDAVINIGSSQFYPTDYEHDKYEE